MINKLYQKYRSKDLMKNSMQSFVMQIFGMAVSFVLILFISRLYNVEILGLYTIAFVILQICGMLSVSGLDSAAVKFVAIFKQKKEYYSLNGFFVKSTFYVVITSLVLSVILFLLADYISEFIMHNAKLRIYLQSTAICILPYSLVSFYTGFFRGNGNNFLWITFKSVIIPLAYFIILIFATYFQSNAIDFLSQYYAVSVFVTFFIAAFFLHKVFSKEEYSIKYFKNISDPLFSEIKKVAFPMFMFSSSLMLSSWLNTILLGSLGTTKDIGIYRVLERISTLSFLALQAVNSVIAPKIAAAFSQNNILQLKRHVFQSIELVFWSSLPIQILLIVFASFILNFFGKDFIMGRNALYIIMAAQIINSLCGPVAQILTMTSYQKYVRNISFLTLGISAIIGYLTIPKMGLIGAAFSIFANVSIFNILLVFKVKKEFDFWTIYFPADRVMKLYKSKWFLHFK